MEFVTVRPVMEDRDPLVALQACIAAVRRGGVGEEGSTSPAELERCLRRVWEALSERDREIEWLREVLEQSRESYEERSRALGQLPGLEGETLVDVVGGVATVTASEQDTRGLRLEQENGRTTESAYECVGVPVTGSVEDGERRPTTVDGSYNCG